MEKILKIKHNNPLTYSLYFIFLYPIFIDLLANFIASSLLVVIGNAMILLCLLLLFIKKGIKKDILIVYIITVLSFLIYFTNTQYCDLYLSSSWGIVNIFGLHTGITGYVIARYIGTENEFFDIFKKIIIILFTYNCFLCLEPIRVGYWMENGVKMVYNMKFGYSMAIPVVFLIYYYFKERKSIYLFLVVVGSILILLFASRGALLCLGVYVMVKIYQNTHKHRSLKVFGIICLLLGMYMLITDQQFMVSLNNNLKELGISSRTIGKMARGLTVDDTGRGVIREGLNQFFESNRMFIGYGPLADNVLTGHYVHNIFIELLITYGYIVGFVLIVLLIRNIFLGYSKSQYKEIILIFFCLSIPKLLVSSSFWYEISFWVLLGLIISGIKQQRKVTKIKKFERKL